MWGSPLIHQLLTNTSSFAPCLCSCGWRPSDRSQVPIWLTHTQDTGKNTKMYLKFSAFNFPVCFLNFFFTCLNIFELWHLRLLHFANQENDHSVIQLSVKKEYQRMKERMWKQGQMCAAHKNKLQQNQSVNSFKIIGSSNFTTISS